MLDFEIGDTVYWDGRPFTRATATDIICMYAHVEPLVELTYPNGERTVKPAIEVSK